MRTIPVVLTAAAIVLFGFLGAGSAGADPGEPCTGIAAVDATGCYPAFAHPGQWGPDGSYTPSHGPMIDPNCATWNTCVPGEIEP